MNATVAAPDLRLLAPIFAGRFAVIVASLAALIARAFLHQPSLAPLIVPLYRRLTRTARHLTALMTRREAKRSGANSGRGASPTAKRPRGAPRGRPRTPRLPTTRAWLIHTLGYEAAGYASQLSHLLAEPGVSDLLDAAPAARRLLNPLCRMLGLPLTAPRAVASDRCAPSPTESPDPPPRGVASPATAFFPFKSPESAATVPPPRGAPRALPPPPCSHVGWPWFPHPAAKRA